MAYLKEDSVPAQQEMRARKVCQIMLKKAKEFSSKNRKSYVVGPEPFDDGPVLPYFSDRPFGRG